MKTKNPIYFFSFFTIVIFGVILGLSLTYEAVKSNIEISKNRTISSLLNKKLECSKYKIVNIDDGEVFYCSNSEIIAIHTHTKRAYADKIEYLAFFSKDGLIKHIDIISHKETPGLGDKIEDVNWLKTLYNKGINHLSLKQDGGDIDSFTSASITPRALLSDLQTRANWVKYELNNFIDK